ncbi:hypothetical protein Tco_0922840 [Tanacetum coccineum]|uniref:Tf2-1-like SH3-like domain-containing protein n=1 Tax=Tanacetum coccineum TaxID=301880 RepID=A0ABQ5CZA0_9ASTR
MTTQSIRCKTCAHILTQISEEIKKAYIQSFRTISENQCLLQILKVIMIGRRYIIKAFKDSNRYEHVRLKISVWQSQSERRSQNNSKELNSGDDQLRLRWMIYLVVLADTAESVRDTIGFEYCLASSSRMDITALYGMKCRSPVLWAEIGESSLIRPELVQETTDKVVLIKEKLKAPVRPLKELWLIIAQKLEFEVEDRVMLKVSPWKGVICFGKKGKLALRYVGPFEILERIGHVDLSG